MVKLRFRRPSFVLLAALASVVLVRMLFLSPSKPEKVIKGSTGVFDSEEAELAPRFANLPFAVPPVAPSPPRQGAPIAQDMPKPPFTPPQSPPAASQPSSPSAAALPKESDNSTSPAVNAPASPKNTSLPQVPPPELPLSPVRAPFVPLQVPQINDSYCAGPFLDWTVEYGAFNQFVNFMNVLPVAEVLNVTFLLPQLQTRVNWTTNFEQTKYRPVPFEQFFDLDYFLDYWNATSGKRRTIPRIIKRTDWETRCSKVPLTTVPLKLGMKQNGTWWLDHATEEVEGRFGPNSTRISVVYKLQRYLQLMFWPCELTPEHEQICSRAVESLKPSAEMKRLSQSLLCDVVRRAAGAPVVGVHFRMELDFRIIWSNANGTLDEYVRQFELLPRGTKAYLAVGVIAPDMADKVHAQLRRIFGEGGYFTKHNFLSDVEIAAYPAETLAFIDAIVLQNLEMFIGHPSSSMSVVVHQFRTRAGLHSVLLPPIRALALEIKFNSTELTPFFRIDPVVSCPWFVPPPPRAAPPPPAAPPISVPPHAPPSPINSSIPINGTVQLSPAASVATPQSQSVAGDQPRLTISSPTSEAPHLNPEPPG